MPKFRLISLFIFVAVVAFFLAANESHRRGRLKLDWIDKHVDAVELEIEIQFYATSIQEFLRLNEIRSDLLQPFQHGGVYTDLTAYRDAGASQSRHNGGLFAGSSEIERNIFMGAFIPPSILGEDDILFARSRKVRLQVICALPWRLFAGTPYVKIVTFDAPMNEQFVELLKQRLIEDEIEFSVEQKTE